MKYLFQLITLFIHLLASAQTHKIPASDTLNVIKNTDGTYALKEKLADGEWLVLANGFGENIIISSTYKNGKREGKYTENYNYTYEKKSAVSNYTNGKLNGIFMAWHGRVGELLSDSGYYKNGNKEGIYKTWAKFDKSAKEVKYINGQAQGIALEYDKNGKKIKEWNYKNDKLEGKYTAWDKDGNVIETGTYKSDKKEGDFFTYYSNGKTKNKTNYKSGKQEGEAISFYETGEKWTASTYKNDKIDGTHTIYYKNGQMKRRTFESQKANGSNASWYENGQIESVAIINYQKMRTDVYLWSNKGVLIKEEHHKIKISVQGDVPIKIWDTMKVYNYIVSMEETGEMKSPKTTVTEKLEKQLIPRPQEYYQIFAMQRLDGIRKTWAENGNLIGVQSFSENRPIGLETHWDSQSGVKTMEGSYEINKENQGRKHGKWLKWSPQGNLMSEEIYEYGNLINEKTY